MPKNASGSAAPPDSGRFFELRGEGFTLRVDAIPDEPIDRFRLALRIVGTLALHLVFTSPVLGSPRPS
ncbi:hypothetical protein [Streptomyces sp. C10-9-1]|uniref:hypothetical protein n=1 Tax=Streptomyces sp. C10-9-1 TaxID=1859285 RepID=UPI003D7236AB